MTMNSMNGGPRSSLRMEFPRHRLTELRSLGNGAYGQAFLARASGKREGDKAVTVVVKSLVNGDDRVREAFNKEMNALCGLRHDNVVTLVGVCKEDEPLYMIFESMEKVCLVDFFVIAKQSLVNLERNSSYNTEVVHIIKQLFHSIL